MHSRGLTAGRFLFLTKKLTASSSDSDSTMTASTAFSLPLADIDAELVQLIALWKTRQVIHHVQRQQRINQALITSATSI